MAERLRSTPEMLLNTAERLFAEHGIGAVSNRRVAEEAGAANNYAVGYHFGTKTELILAITRRYVLAMDRIRERMLADVAGSRDPATTSRAWWSPGPPPGGDGPAHLAGPVHAPGQDRPRPARGGGGAGDGLPVPTAGQNPALREHQRARPGGRGAARHARGDADRAHLRGLRAGGGRGRPAVPPGLGVGRAVRRRRGGGMLLAPVSASV
ncbi:helix-turn-helix domain-containing protein [Streptomyces sp. M19]